MNRIPLRSTKAPADTPRAPGLRPQLPSVPSVPPVPGLRRRATVAGFTQNHRTCCPSVPQAVQPTPAPPAPVDVPQTPGLRPQLPIPSLQRAAARSPSPPPFVPQAPVLRPLAQPVEPTQTVHTSRHRTCCPPPAQALPRRQLSLRTPRRPRAPSGFVRPSLGPRAATPELIVEMDQSRGLRPRRDPNVRK